MNKKTKGAVIGAAGGVGTQLGMIGVYLIEQGWHELPIEIDQAFVAVIAAGAAWIAYNWLPASR